MHRASPPVYYHLCISLKNTKNVFSLTKLENRENVCSVFPFLYSFFFSPSDQNLVSTLILASPYVLTVNPKLCNVLPIQNSIKCFHIIQNHSGKQNLFICVFIPHVHGLDAIPIGACKQMPHLLFRYGEAPRKC